MRFLIVSQYFWPETFIINDLAANLQSAGHQVTVATGKPNYPGGAIFTGYRQSGVQNESYGGKIPVIRVPMRPRGAGKRWDIVRNYLSFVAQALWHLPRRLSGKEYDVILVFGVSPITAAIPAIWLKQSRRAHLAIWVQDLWPDSLEMTGYVRNRGLLRGVGQMVRWIYGAADTILVQSDAFVEQVARYADPSKLVVFTNFASDAPSVAKPIPDAIQREFDRDHFNILFAGNLGKVQSLGTILAAAEQLQGRADDIQFLVAGTGSEAESMRAGVEERKLDNIRLLGRLDSALMPDLFRRADALLVTLADAPALEATVPSKIQAYMQAERPIIGALNGEGARVIRLAAAGYTVPSGDGEGLARAILTLARMPSNKRAEMGRNARSYFLEHFEAKRAASRLVTILSSRLRQKGISCAV